MNLYRYEMVDHGTNVTLNLEVFKVAKETPCGYWVERFIGSRVLASGFDHAYYRWVSRNATKRYCYPTKEQALTSYKIRKRKYLMHCQRRLDIAEIAVHLDLNRASTPKPSKLHWSIL